MSIGGELEIGSGLLEDRRTRWRYVNGGLRTVILPFGGSGSASKTDAIAEYEW